MSSLHTIMCRRCLRPFTYLKRTNARKRCFACEVLDDREAVHDYHTYKFWPKHGFNPPRKTV